MSRCLIFCAGGFDGLLDAPCPEDRIIAADGGYAHVQKLGLRPDCVLGDFDSLGYVPGDARVYPVKKDDTDAMLAVRRGLELGCRQFLLYGSLDGPRLDHTVANFQLLQYLADHEAVGWLIGNTHIVTLVHNGQLTFPADATGYLSVFCFGPDARGVTIRRAEYNLEQATLSAGFPLGVSNRFIGQPVEICVEDGSLLVVYDRKNGLCEVASWKNKQSPASR